MTNQKLENIAYNTMGSVRKNTIPICTIAGALVGSVGGYCSMSHGSINPAMTFGFMTGCMGAVSGLMGDLFLHLNLSFKTDFEKRYEVKLAKSEFEEKQAYAQLETIAQEVKEQEKQHKDKYRAAGIAYLANLSPVEVQSRINPCNYGKAQYVGNYDRMEM